MKSYLLMVNMCLVICVCQVWSQITYNMTVAKDGSGDYTTVQAAFNAVPKNSSSRTVIYIKNGTYTEKLELPSDRKNVTIIGQDKEKVKLTYGDYSGKIVNGDTIGTSTSRSTYIAAEGFCALNVTFENSSGPVGQALAIYIGGDKSVFYNCKFLGRQDTWYAGSCRQFIRKCYIEGTTDFMFGGSTAWVDSCTLYTYGGSAITAASTDQNVTYGYVFRYCSISGESGKTTTLGRPWRPYASVSFLDCSMTSCISAAGWNNWGNTANESTARYSEYKNTGTGASTSGRVSWAKQLTDAQAATYTYKNILKATCAVPQVTDNWDPMATLSLYLSGSTEIHENSTYQSHQFTVSIINTHNGGASISLDGAVSGHVAKLSVMSLDGRVHYIQNKSSGAPIIWSLPIATKGIYLLRVCIGGNTLCKRIVL